MTTNATTEAQITGIGWKMSLVDPDKNHDKFYTLWQFGDLAVANYGRRGTRGTYNVRVWESAAVARAALISKTSEKEQAGYQLAITPRAVTISISTLDRLRAGEPVVLNVTETQPEI